jgi:hypothetical protein
MEYVGISETTFLFRPHSVNEPKKFKQLTIKGSLITIAKEKPAI